MNAPRDIARRGIMLVVSSPSGAGKTTLTLNLLEQEENVSLSISVTTRARRAISKSSPNCPRTKR